MARTAELGPWLRRARIRRDITQAELAEEVDTEQSMVAMVETGEAAPSAALEKRLREWIRSGHRPARPSARGAYRK